MVKPSYNEFVVMLLALALPVQGAELRGGFETKLVVEAERLLSAFRVPGPYVVEFVGPVGNVDGTSTMTSCLLRTANGVLYSGFLRNGTGRLFDLRSEVRHMSGSEKRLDGSQTPDAQRARARMLMASAGSPCSLLPLEDEFVASAWKGREDRLSFPISVHGFRFLHPSLSYGVTLDAKTGELREFTVPDVPPPVGPLTARLTRADATAIAKRLLVGDAPQPYVNRRMKPWVDYAVDPESLSYAKTGYAPVRLGWFLVPGEGAARLTWKVPYIIDHHGTGGTKGSLLAFMVDAITGEALPSENLSGTL